ncbi:unnamed protein product [Durusdinium trenchii]|uniref:RRM domain-containing protein n=1 Tax=Durusdinium trenchii TaxID=1381693 RepID=A0ABP0SEY0_9DINO
MYIFLLPLLVVRTGAYRRTILERTEWKDLRVELWTWNSGKANLQQEADRLAATNADILVTCQTEATADISTFLKEEWTLLAHGEHWGAAGGAINAQIANAFLRTPLDGFNYVIDASKAYSKLWRQDVGPRTTLRRQSSGYFNDLLHAKAQVIATDYKGKGGISIELVFPSYQDQKDLRLDFVCAHLDSEMNEKRHFGVAELLSRVRSDDVDVASNIRSEACGKKGDLRQPCALFDRELPSCNVTEGSHLPPPPDAVFLFGDLNYRLKKTGLEDMSQAWLLDWTKREALGHNDHLVNGADPLVKEPESGGFGFTCNKPFALYPPTYKRKGGQVHWEKTIEFSKFHNTALDDALHATMGLEIEITNSTGGKLDIDALLDPKKILEAPAFPITVKTKPFEACSKVGEALSQCGQVKQPECKEWVLAFAKQCYRKKEDKALMDKYGLERWAVKKDDLQLGWLDRFCFREIKRDSTLKVSLLGEAGWMDYPGIKDKQNGSDHMPVAATFLVSSTTCNCPKVKRNMMISGCQVADSGVLRFGELSVVTCKSGYALDTRQKSEIIKCGQYGKTEVQGDGHLTFDALKCVKVCEAPYQAPSSIPSSPFSPPEGLVLEGDEVRAKCRPRNGGQMPLSLGESRMRCGSDGLFRPIGKPPICAPTCKNNFDKAYFLLEERRAAANEILSEYATEVNSKLAWQPMKVAEGGFFKYSCRNECITMGNRKQTCMDGLLDGHGQQMFCGCLLELRLTKMVFDDSWMKDEVQKIKLQLYKGPLTEDQLHHVRSSKGYLSQQKFHLEDVGKEQLILSAIPSKELEIHLTVCSRHGKRSLFSSCGIFAETSADSLNLVPFIEGGSSHTGNFDLPLAVKHQEGAELKASRVTLSFSFNAAAHILDGEKLGPPEGDSETKRRKSSERLIRVQGHRLPTPGGACQGAERHPDPPVRPTRTTSSAQNSDGPRLRPVLVPSSQEPGSRTVLTRPPAPPKPSRSRQEGAKPPAESPAPKVLAPTEGVDGKISFYTLRSKPQEPVKVEESSEHTTSKSSDEASDSDGDKEIKEPEVKEDKDKEEEKEEDKEEDKEEEKEEGKEVNQDQEMKEEEADEGQVEDREEAQTEEPSCIYFHNVPFEVDEEDLMPLFERAGKVRAMCLFRLKDGRSRGQGLCQFNASGTASKAVDMLSGCFLANPLNESSKDSRELFVKLHRGSAPMGYRDP